MAPIKANEEQQKIIDDAWLGIELDENRLADILEVPKEFADEPNLWYTYIMSKPEYFQLITKHIFNLEGLSPMQLGILEEVWNRKFPMLIASRGFGKCVVGDTLIQTEEEICTIEEKIGATAAEKIPVYNLGKVLNQYGTYNTIEYGWNNGHQKTVKIKTSCGFELEGTLNHPVKVVRGCEVVWVNLEDVKKKDRVLIDKTKTWPAKAKDMSIEEAYALGKSLVIDKNTIFPSEMLKVNKRAMAYFIKGLMDSKGKYYPTHYVFRLHSQSEQFTKTLQFVLTRFGIISSIFNKKDSYEIATFGKDSLVFKAEIGYKDMKPIFKINPKYFIKPYVFDEVVEISTGFKKTYDVHCVEEHSFISNAFISHNTYLMGIYCLLRLMLMPGRKIVVAGAGFRQSKLVFDYMENVWKNAPLLRDMFRGSDNGPRHGVDEWTFVLGKSILRAIPIGNGEKIRGLRANDLLVDEFSCLGKETLVQTNRGLIRISNYLNGEVNDLLNKDGNFETPDKIFITPKVDVYKITTDYGYSFRCSKIHKMMTSEGWKQLDELQVGDYLEVDNNEYFPTQEYNNIDEKLGWLIGLCISEGTMTNRNFIEITNTDHSLITKIKNLFTEYDWKEYSKEEYIDKRGFKCKKAYSLKLSNTKFRTYLESIGCNYATSHDKVIPFGILQSPRNVVVNFIKGLFDGDGSGFLFNDRKSFGMSYYSVSEQLINELQILLLKFGIYSSKVKKGSNLSNRPQWVLSIRGSNTLKLQKLIKLDKAPNIDSINEYNKKPTIISKNGKFLCSTYRCNKNVYLGTFNTKEECISAFNEFWLNKKHCLKIRSIEKMPEQEVLYDFHLPETHSFIGNGFVQHNSINREIFETVLAGFGAVAANPMQNVKLIAARKKAQELNIKFTDNIDDKPIKSNQIIISGTASYDFEHFAEYWRRWHDYICSKGDMKKLSKYSIDKDFNWRDYSIIRVPFELIPEGFMDASNVSRARASSHTSVYLREYGACFPKDSLGFFKRTAIDAATIKPTYEPNSMPADVSLFYPVIIGKKESKYVLACDPASDVDNLSIVILEVNKFHNRTVYCWTTNKKAHLERLQKGLTTENNYYAYCARKIRDLYTKFPIEYIVIDSQGGGKHIVDAINDKDKMLEGEDFMWPIVEEDVEKPTDRFAGKHIVIFINFADADWTSSANHGLRKDIEDKTLIFPFFDPVYLAEIALQDKDGNPLYDTTEDCVFEIEELKNELCTIVQTKTPNGRDRWDTPEIKTNTGKKGRMRKDRYSALLMANSVARELQTKTVHTKPHVYVAGFAGDGNYRYDKNEKLYQAPDWFNSNW